MQSRLHKISPRPHGPEPIITEKALIRCHRQGLSCRRGIVFGQQIHAVLVHADTLPLGVFGQGLVQTFRDSQLELAGVAFQIIRLPDGDTVLQSGFKPGPLGILSIGYRRFHRFPTGDTPRQVRVGHHIATLGTIFYNLHAVRQGLIFILRFSWHHFLRCLLVRRFVAINSSKAILCPLSLI